MWLCVNSAGVITCQLASNCFKYYNLSYDIRFAWCYWDKILKFNVFPFSRFRPSACRITSRRLTATRGGGMANDWKWLWYCSMSSGWHTLPLSSHPDEIANFDFPQHAVALQRFRRKRTTTATPSKTALYIGNERLCTRCISLHDTQWPQESVAVIGSAGGHNKYSWFAGKTFCYDICIIW